MAKITLQTLFEEIKKSNAVSDVRFEFLKEQIQLNGAEISGLRSEMKTEFASVRSEMKTEFANVRSEMKTEFTKVHRDLKVIRDQTALVTERVATLEHTQKQSPSA